MPYVIRKPPKRLGMVLACMLTAGTIGVGATPALAKVRHRSVARVADSASQNAASQDSSQCSEPMLTQPFLAWGDRNWYTIVPGESPDSFGGAGWTLSGGAKLVQTTLYDGTSGYVLDLPSGSRAVSPTLCVSSNYPTARTMVRNVVGSEGVFFYVSYAGTQTWNTPKNTGQVHGNGTAWTLSDPVNIQPSNSTGWQLVQFTFIPGGQHSEFQIYNFYVDPYAKR